jgi:VWFA-related protein
MTMKSRITVVKTLAAAAILALSVQPGPSGQDRKQDRPLRHDAAAIVKLIAVRILGPDGRPIAGLRKEDFRLTEDGQPKTITEFEAHAITPAGMTMAPAPPPAGEAAGRAAGVTNRKLFFFLDQQASDREGKDKALAAAVHFIETQVRPGDEVAVLGWYTASGFYIREYLTADLDKIRQALNGPTEVPPSAGEAIIVPADEVDSGVEDSGAGRNARETLEAKTEGYGFSLSREGRPRAAGAAPGSSAFARVDFVPSLAEIAEIFKTIPGHKSLILFTARNMGPDAERLGRLFGAAGTAVFVVNTQDWKAGPFGTKFHYIWTEHSLKGLAAASGGSYFADINDAAAIARDVQDLTGNYYVLGYYVQDSWEGKYHKIRIEVDRPGARVLVQDGFSDSKPFDTMSDFERDIHLLDLLWSEEPPSGLPPLPVDPLLVRIGGTAQGCFLTRWEIGAKTGPPAAPVEVFALLKDEKGEMLVSQKWDVDLTPHGGRALWAYLSHPLAAGSHELRLVIRDRRTGESWVGRSRLDVPAPVDADIQLGSPLLFEDGPSAHFLRLPTGKRKASKGIPVAAAPSLQGLYRLIPKDGIPVVGELSAEARRVIAVIPLEIRPFPADDKPILSVEATLRSLLDGSEIPLEVEIREYVTHDGGPDILAADLILGNIPPGRYELEITVEDMGTDRRASCRKTLIRR